MRRRNLRRTHRAALTLLGVTAIAIGLMTPGISVAWARSLSIFVEEIDHIPKLRAAYPVPNEPNMLFYVQRSVNANTVVYVSRFDPRHRLDRDAPVDVYWRLYNIDGHRRPLNLIERLLAYGVTSVAALPSQNAIGFRIAAIPEFDLLLEQDRDGRPQAMIRFGNRLVRLVYVYLQVDDRGMMPRVTALDLFGTDKITGKPLHEHVIPD